MHSKIIHLTPPQLSDHQIKEKIVCVRAHRERIFRVAAETVHDKLVIHNYGQGGAGWTFLFGCVQKSLDLLEEHPELHSVFKKKPITVIGAGCYGLLTAIMLARKGYEVRIAAKDLNNIPSNKAAGFFFPRARKCSTPEERAIFKEMGFASYRAYKDIVQGKHPFIHAGPKILPAYYSPLIDPELGPYITEGLIPAPTDVAVDFGTGKQYDLIAYQSLFINPALLMQELWRNITELRIPVSVQEITDLSEIPEAIIFNCAGSDAKKFAQDKRVVPVQGHLITLHNQPSTEHLNYLLNVKVTMTDLKGRPRDELIYYAPKDSGILGITFLRGQDSLTSNYHEFDRLLERARLYFGT